MSGYLMGELLDALLVLPACQPFLGTPRDIRELHN